MKKIISLILSVTMLASAAQLYASADITPVAQSETTQEITQSSAQTTDESIKTAESENNSTALTESKTETAETENNELSQPVGINTVNSPMLTDNGPSGNPVEIGIGNTFYAKIINVNADKEVALEHNDSDSTITGNDNVVIYSNSKYRDNIWKFTSYYVSNGDYYYYTIQNMYNNKYLSVANAPSSDKKYEENVTLKEEYTNDGLQNWCFFPYNNNYVIRLTGAYAYLDVYGGFVDDNTNVLTFEFNGNANQQFKVNVLPTGPELPKDKETVTSDAIKFKLFNYNDNINRVGGVSGAAFRSLAPYFSFYDFSGVQKWHSDYFNNRTNYDDDYKANHATVETTLDSNGYPTLRLDNKTDSKGNAIADPLPNPDDRSLAYLFGGDSNNEAVESYSPVNTLLQEMTTTNGVIHYYYNSKPDVSSSVTKADANAVDYDKVTDQFRVRDYTESITGLGDDITSTAEFLPFCTTYSTTNHEIPKDSVDYWFGMRMDVDFIQSANGRINNEDMEFKFTGDDDIWVFIDGVLVLDLGGTHDAVTGSINFATGEVKSFLTTDNTVNYSTTLKEQFVDKAGIQPNGGWNNNGKTFADYTSHTLSFFYLERGAGLSTCCMDFNLPTMPDGSLAVAKDVVSSSNENLNNKDNTDYTFRLSRTDSDISDIELENFTKHNKDGSTETGNGTVTTVSDGNDYYEFTLQGSESIYFTRLDESVTYKIEEITSGQSFIKSTKSEIIGIETGDTYGDNTVTISPAATDSKTVKFTNTIKSVDVTLKYYGRETVNGKPADIKKEPTTYTKTYLASTMTDEDYQKYFGTGVAVGQMIVDASTNLTPDNLLDTYNLWTTQKYASGANGNTGIKYLATTNDTKQNPYYTIVSKNYSDTNNYQYHANCYGKPVVGEKWVTYYNSSGTDVDYESNNTLDVTKVTVWLFNTPKQYLFEAYEAQEFGNLSQIGNSDVYVANKSRTKAIYAYYNQRLGMEIDSNAEYSQATNHLKNYEINSYVGQKLDTAYSVEKDDGTTLKFAYWAFDENGKNIASTDILYNYRIVTNTKLYAVYTTDGKVNDGKPGLTVSENERDVFFNSSGTSITRLNTEMNPYNCQNKDANIKNVAIVYVIDQDGSLVTNYTEEMREEIKTNLTSVSQDSALTEDKKNSFTITLNEGNHKVNYFAFVVDGFNTNTEGDIILTNKNRIEFGSDFQTKVLYGDGDQILPKRMYAFAAMYYDAKYKDESGNEQTYGWIVSDNFIDYNFTTTSATAE